jgi:uncharacterized membrane protein
MLVAWIHLRAVAQGSPSLHLHGISNRPVGKAVQAMAKHLTEEFKKIQTLQDVAANKITAFSGSMMFVYIHAIIFAVWIIVNLVQDKKGFDPFPFGLLTLIVSLEAIFLSTFVMLSQNIEAKQADIRAQLDYEVNVKAEKEVEEIRAMLAEMRQHQLKQDG